MLQNNRNNKGSVLIVSFLVFSIIITVTVVSISWIFTNRKIFDLEYKDNVLKENSLSGSEIVKSNVLRNIRKAIDTTSDENGFNEYFLGNNMHDFINDIKDINNSGLENVSINITNNRVIEESGYLLFEVISTAKNENYYKTLNVDVAIKNPYKIEDSLDEIENEKLFNIKSEYEKTEKNIQIDLDECDYLRFYNYRGL